ncbi:hypothetical protein BG28_10125 [Nesterenkonia sp. AN1]|uniref:DUF2075 domain-containing protein n=1 Tax=Nesterenkonia sp. AN1 TaxID=652017 RepID=UPI000450EC72|nr:DUF2075 domain-containing protein [Nesterenkonia sp. AN1]EXF25779.1 hypothetical protein BG28_10125 [Nesterenkonia sp. AN1]
MTSFEIRSYPFAKGAVSILSDADERYGNWPAVYTLRNERSIYVGESRNVASRIRQHLASGAKDAMQHVQIILDDTFNKSAALDLEAFLIEYLGGDDRYVLLNRNKGIVNGDYFDRAKYRETFQEIFEDLRSKGIFERSLPEIQNDDLFKLSPFKALTPEQAVAVEDILRDLLGRVPGQGHDVPIVVQGDPGTGKTVVAIYLMKLLADIGTAEDAELDTTIDDSDSRFAEFFTEGNRERLSALSIGFVVPQQSLRASVAEVFKHTPYLERSMVLDPFAVGESEKHFDVLVVDEAHRLNQRANQPSASQNTRFTEINQKLFGHDESHYTQLDWIKQKSDHQILFLDGAQSVRPADIPRSSWESLLEVAKSADRHHELHSQMRVQAGRGYIDYVRAILRSEAPGSDEFADYEIEMFYELQVMHDRIRERDAEHGLARLVAGYAWEWRSKKDKSLPDIVLDGYGLQWNRTTKDWINSSTSLDEVGSIHTVQGYDLNYAGVIIGSDLRFDTEQQRIVFDRSNYFDKKGKENNPRLGLEFNDEDLLEYVINIYGVLLTRGIKGTYVYVCDPDLREYLAPYFTQVRPGNSRPDLGKAPSKAIGPSASDAPGVGDRQRQEVRE